MPKWSAQHYNALAKEIREIFPVETTESIRGYIDEPTRIIARRGLMVQRATLSTLATNLARRFKEDNPLFDPVKFLVVPT